MSQSALRIGTFSLLVSAICTGPGYAGDDKDACERAQLLDDSQAGARAGEVLGADRGQQLSDEELDDDRERDGHEHDREERHLGDEHRLFEQLGHVDATGDGSESSRTHDEEAAQTDQSRRGSSRHGTPEANWTRV